MTVYSKLVAKMLGHVFSIHGTEDKLHVKMVDYYEAMCIRLTCLNEVIDKQSPELHSYINRYLDKKEKPD